MTTATNGRRITTHEATITTAAIEIKTLTVRGKQVTLALYRQLIEEPLVDDATADLVGVPWGKINYHPGNCEGDYGEHLHIVWQQGSELRRSAVLQYRSPDRRVVNDLKAQAQQIHARGALLAEALLHHHILQGEKVVTRNHGREYGVSDGRPDGLTWWVENSWRLQVYLKATDDERLTLDRDRLRQDMHDLARQANITDPPAAWTEILATLGVEKTRYLAQATEAWNAELLVQQKYERQYQALDALDQLFIAV
jgi:hypothetical protein